MNTNDESNHNNAPTEPSEAGSVRRVVRRLWETFDRRASTWQRDAGEMGEIIATELRTLNNAYLDALGGDEKVS